MSSQAHWERIHSEKADSVSWFQPVPELSLALIEDAALPQDAPIIDVGGGTSRLVDRLLEAGYRNVSVMDIADAALARSRTRLGKAGAAVDWIQADATRVELPTTYRLWHDRAVFHFLVETAPREAYLDRLKRHLEPGGQAIIATFAPDGPTTCSGLAVQRYSADSLAKALGSGLRLLNAVEERHITPAGAAQAFIYCRFVRDVD